MSNDGRGATRRLRRASGQVRRSAPVFTLAVGFLAGVLVTTLAAPRTPDVVIEGSGAVAPDGAVVVPQDRASSGANGADIADQDSEGEVLAPEVAGPRDASGSTGTSGTSTGDTSDGAGGTTGSGDDATDPTEPRQPTADQPTDNGGATARGVTGESIRIGVGVLDIGALRNLGPAFDNGDVQEQMEAWLEGVRRDGLLPINGRDLEFVYREYQPSQLDVASQRQACAGFVDDDQVFAVIAGSQFQIGAECVAREKRTPVITSDGVIEEAYDRSAPFLYTLQPSLTRLNRNWVHWMRDRGLLDGATIGLYWFNNTEQNTLVSDVIKPTLEALGYQVAAEHETDQALGGPQDAVAVQRFQQAGVDLALLLTSKAGFMRQADQAEYHPTYADSDYNSGTSNTATTQYPKEQFDGTQGLTAMRWGEWVAGMPQTQPAQTCVRYYEEKTGRRVDPSQREAEWVGMNKACDTGWVLLEALRRAGPTLTHERLAGAIQAISDIRLGMHLDVTFGAGQYHGFTRQRTVAWSAQCTCWAPVAGTDGSMWVR